MTALPAPGLTIRQQFAPTVSAVSQSLRAFLVGPSAYLSRYAEADEKDDSLLGAYDEVGTLIDGQMQTLYSWPGRPVGSSVDLAYSRIHCEKALLRYFHDTSHNVTRVAGYRNRVRLASATFTGDNGGTISVGDRGAKIGDLVYLSGVDSNTDAFSLATSIIGFKGDAVAASVAAPAAASSNAAALVAASATVTAGTSNSGSIDATADATAYTGLASGKVIETYTITVITGGTAANARLRVISASGTDDQASVTPAALASATNIGARGLKVTFAQGLSTSFTVGDSWTVLAKQAVTVPTLTISGTYTGTVDRTYVLEVVAGATITSGSAKIRITSQDGGDTLPTTTLTLNSGTTSQSFAFGSYGLTATINASTGLVYGDKWLIAVTAAGEGDVHTLILAHDLPSNVATDTSALMELELFIQRDVEIPAQSLTAGQYNWVAEATQVRLLAGITLEHADWTVSGALSPLTLVHRSGFGAVSQLYATYRAWYAASAGIIGVGPNDDLDAIIAGPTDPDNPLKYALSLALSASAGETVHIFNVGDPALTAGWTQALTLAARTKDTYGLVPLSLDADIQGLFNAHVKKYGSGARKGSYRVLWLGSEHLTGGAVVSSANSSDSAQVLATTEDDPSAAGTQYTLLRLSGSNADFLTMGVRAGDEVRYFYAIDEWGNETYTARTVDSVLSATTLLVTSSFGSLEAVPKRVEIHRTYAASDLVTQYGAAASSWSSDLVRYVLAPSVVIGSYELPSYYMAAILAGMRAANVPQQSLSTRAVSGVANVHGLDLLTESDLDELAGKGCLITYYEYDSADVRIRHCITTGESSNLPQREESMVACRHIALFMMAQRLKPYVANINLRDDLSKVQGIIFAELTSLKKELQALHATEALGGVISDMTINSISSPAGLEDTLAIDVTLELGRPGNYIDVNVLVV